MAFSATDSAFEGFRIIRREPATVVAWGVLMLAFSVAISVAMLPAMRGFSTGLTFPPANPGAPAGLSAAQMAAFSSLSGLYLVLLPLELILFSVLSAAVYRAVLRPQDKGLARLKFGGDELRLMGLWVLLSLLFMAVGIAVMVVLGIIVAVVAISARSSPGGIGIAALVVFVLYLAVFVAYCWVAVRLSLAGPMTFAQRRLNLFGSWKLTKGRFWPLFGCYLLTGIFAVLIGLVEMAVLGVLNLGLSGGSLVGAFTAWIRPDFSSYASYFSAARIVSLLVAAPFGAAFWTLMAAAPAEAYREIAGPKAEDQAEAFS